MATFVQSLQDLSTASFRVLQNLSTACIQSLYDYSFSQIATGSSDAIPESARVVFAKVYKLHETNIQSYFHEEQLSGNTSRVRAVWREIGNIEAWNKFMRDSRVNSGILEGIVLWQQCTFFDKKKKSQGLGVKFTLSFFGGSTTHLKGLIPTTGYQNLPLKFSRFLGLLRTVCLVKKVVVNLETPEESKQATKITYHVSMLATGDSFYTSRLNFFKPRYAFGGILCAGSLSYRQNADRTSLYYHISPRGDFFPWNISVSVVIGEIDPLFFGHVFGTVIGNAGKQVLKIGEQTVKLKPNAPFVPTVFFTHPGKKRYYLFERWTCAVISIPIEQIKQGPFTAQAVLKKYYVDRKKVEIPTTQTAEGKIEPGAFVVDRKTQVEVFLPEYKRL